ncbi:MAG: hypothetical protein H6719_16935 [Sandaracinaceae bacterium]|nr:hypothetical protein [Sandaracinaceae bacterium]
MASTGAGVTRLERAPLSAADVARLLGQGLERDPASIAELVDVLHDKARGNPFFLRRLVEDAAAAGAFRLDAESLTWGWDLAALRSLSVADNVVALLRSELERLSGDARECLAGAALLGDRFDLAGLRLATDLDDEALAVAVAAAIEGRFVQPLDDDYWAAGLRTSRPFRFAFVHDRVQQAARELLSDEERARLHLAIARGLAASEDEVEASPFRPPSTTARRSAS